MLQNYNTLTRLYVASPLLRGNISLSKEASHYLGTVLRKQKGESVRIFNEQSGEFLCIITETTRSAVTVEVGEQLRAPQVPSGPTLLFSPLKHDALLFLLEKATELGVYGLQPVLCERTVVRHFSEEKAKKRVIEAAEQAERLWIPHVYPSKPLKTILENFDPARTLWGAMERDSNLSSPSHVVFDHRPFFLVGPEGGFTPYEQSFLKALPFFKPLTLGANILRAETAALSLLSFCHIAKISSQNTN